MNARETTGSDWDGEVRRRREALAPDRLRDLAQRVWREMEHAQRARAAGNEGRARVCARRAAGWALGELFCEALPAEEGRDALRMLIWLERQDLAPPDLRQAASRLTARLEPGFVFPHAQDPLQDAQWILEQVLGSDWGEQVAGGGPGARPETVAGGRQAAERERGQVRDLRRYADITHRRLVIGAIALVVVLGGGLIALFYGPGALSMALACFAAFGVPAALIAILLGVMGWIVRRERGS